MVLRVQFFKIKKDKKKKASSVQLGNWAIGPRVLVLWRGFILFDYGVGTSTRYGRRYGALFRDM